MSARSLNKQTSKETPKRHDRGTGKRVVQLLRDRWFSFDLRTLGLFRIALGIVLIGNLVQHTAAGRMVAFFTNQGVLTNHFALFAPIQPRVWSFLFSLSTPAEVMVGCLAMFVVYLLFLVGWKTKVMQVLAPICFISMVNRNLFLQDGGSFVTTILLLWTAFLPLGARLSLDSWRASAARPTTGLTSAAGPPAVHVSFVCLALLIQLAFIYGLNGANKAGETWRDGSAVHYILWQNSGNTMLGGWLRHHEPGWLSPLLTYGTLAFEFAAPVLILLPVFQTWPRRILIASMWGFHTGIALLISLGTFSYVMIAYSTLFVSARDWVVLERIVPRWLAAAGRRLPPRVTTLLTAIAHGLRGSGTQPPPINDAPVPDTSDNETAGPRLLAPSTRRRLRRAGVGLREAVFAVIFVASMAELSIVNPLPEFMKWRNRPAWMADVVYYLRIYQIWAMFAPDPPFDNGRLVVDATLADGSHLDPFTGAAPDYDAPFGGPYYFGHDWAEYMAYYPWDRHRAYRFGFRDYILNLMRSAPPERQLRSFDVYFVSAVSPKPGQTQVTGYKKEHLLSYPGP